MPVHRWHRLALVCAAAMTLLYAAAPAFADDGERTAASRLPMLPAYQQECSSCHIAYPPAMLPAASWQRLMSGLPRHFGVDASLDAKTVSQISGWLQAHATIGAKARGNAAPPPEDRITRTAWFVREHREVAAATWQRPSVKSPSHCAACHTRADQGDFNEHGIRIPR
jgi:mono/diheme cytochrome c family protein